jgi:hypothetical protein
MAESISDVLSAMYGDVLAPGLNSSLNAIRVEVTMKVACGSRPHCETAEPTPSTPEVIKKSITF